MARTVPLSLNQFVTFGSTIRLRVVKCSISNWISRERKNDLTEFEVHSTQTEGKLKVDIRHWETSPTNLRGHHQ